MTTLGDLINDTLLAVEGWGLHQGRAAFITTVGGINTTALSFTVGSADNLSEGVAEIGDELIYIQSISGTTVTIAPDGRGYRGTTPGTHAQNARVTMNPVIPRAVVKQKINDTILGVYPKLRGKGSTEFTYNAAVSTYNLPSDLDEVISVTYDSVGTSGVWPRVYQYSVDQNANTTDFTGGKSITLVGPEAGRTVRVVYAKKPTTLTNTGDLLTSTGLAATARTTIVAGALWRLAGYFPVATLQTHTVGMDYPREGRPDPARLAAYLRAQYEVELGEEVKRQVLAQPPTLSFGG